MRYAIVSDIHANLQAWNAVLLDIRTANIDRILCLGDIVGYGARPAEVLQSVYTNVDFLTLGNHDAAVCGKLDTMLFNDNARESIAWTQEQLNEEAVLFLHELPLALRADGFRCTHGDFSDPASFFYVVDQNEAVPSWETVDEPLLFVGHTHRPAIFLLGPSGTPRAVEPQDFELEPDKRYLVNVGSVGIPRDGDTSSSYCIFDTERQSLYWRRVIFDLDAYRADLEAAQLPLESSVFLQLDPRRQVAPLRQQLNFSPPVDEEHRVHDTVEVADLAALKKKAVTWKLLFWSLLALALLVATIVTAVHVRRVSAIAVLQPALLSSIPATTVGPEDEILSLPAGSVPAGSIIPGWRVVMQDRKRQGVAYVAEAEFPHFLLTSATRSRELALDSRPVAVEPGMKLCVQVAFKTSPDYRGSAGISVLIGPPADQPARPPQPLFYKEPNLKRKGDRLLAKKTFDVPANTETVILRVHGSFSGSIEVSDISLVWKEN